MSRADEPLNADEISEVRSRVARCRAARKKPGRYTEFDSRILATIDLLTSRLDAATRERDELLVADALKASELRRSDPELRESVRRWEEIAGKALASNIELTAERDAATRRADEVEKALRRLTLASETLLSSDTDMPSHAGTEREHDEATDEARGVLDRIDAAKEA